VALTAPALAQPTQLFPGTTYEPGVQFTPHGPVALHVVRGPRPVGLYRLRPVLSNESVQRLESVTAMQRRLSSQATAVGINGDFYSFNDGRPNGIVMTDGALANAPNGNRSSAGITLDGTLDIRRVKLFGSWQGLALRHPVNTLNEEPRPNGTALFTPEWGSATPEIPDAVSVILSPFERATPNTDLLLGVSDFYEGGSAPLAPGTAVLVARGTAAQTLLAEAPLGTTMTVRLWFQPGWDTVTDAIGGGPVLVRDGAPVSRANEAFTTSQLAPRHPRSAVGQTADGRILLVAVDGRQTGYSIGMTNFELALAMARLGAVQAMALDGGGSTTMAFDSTVLNRPSEGRERPVSTALMLLYSGVYSSPPAASVYSPNGDGIGERQALSYKVVRPATVTVTLTAPDGAVAFQETVLREPATYSVAFPPPPPAPPDIEGVPPLPPPPPVPPAEGRWTLTVASTDDLGQASTTTRRFWVNSTLGFVKVKPRTLLLRPTRGRSATVTWSQARVANVTVTVETPSGSVIRRVTKRRFQPGQAAVLWDGRLGNRKLAYGGTYRVRVTARNAVGTVSLERQLRVRRVAVQK
jgi:hypothetical protein